MSAGFADAWAAAHSGDAGLTCRHIAGASYSQRLDLVLARGTPVATAASLARDMPSVPTPSCLWPSDRAALIATLRGSGS